MKKLLLQLMLILACATLSHAQSTAPSADQKRSIQLTEEGWKLWQKQEFADALERFQQALELDNTNQHALNGLGWAQFNSGESQAAEVSFRKLIELNPEHGAALNGLGQIYLMQGKMDEAEAFFLKARGAPAAWYGLVHIYLLQQKWADAEKYMQKLIDTKTYGPDEEMAKRLLQAAKDKKLDDNLRSMLAPVAQSEGAREVQRGFALMQKGKLDEAKQCFDHAMELNPDDPNVLNGVGWYRINNADVPGAQQLFEKALEAQPANLGAMNGLATCYKRMGKVDEAIELWKKMMEQYPGANAGAYSLGETYLEREEFAKALPIFEQLAKQWPENESVQQALARAREGSKK